MTSLERTCIKLTYKYGLAHLSSVLNCVHAIERIYAKKRAEAPFILGNAHAGLALYVVLEKYNLCNAEEMIEKHGTHPNRDLANGIWVSGGSLGQPETVAVGMALADRGSEIYLMTSDGACAEGAVWEALRVAGDFSLHNLHVTLIANGWGAYGKIDVDKLAARLNAFFHCHIERVDESRYPVWLRGLPGHYLKLNEEQYKELMA